MTSSASAALASKAPQVTDQDFLMVTVLLEENHGRAGGKRGHLGLVILVVLPVLGQTGVALFPPALGVISAATCTSLVASRRRTNPIVDARRTAPIVPALVILAVILARPRLAARD